MLDLEDLIQSLELTCKDAAVDADSLDRTTRDLSRRHDAAEGLANRISNLRTSLGNALSNAKAIAEIMKEHPGMLNTYPGAKPETSTGSPPGNNTGGYNAGGYTATAETTAEWKQHAIDIAFFRYREIFNLPQHILLEASEFLPDNSVVVSRRHYNGAKMKVYRHEPHLRFFSDGEVAEGEFSADNQWTTTRVIGI